MSLTDSYILKNYFPDGVDIKYAAKTYNQGQAHGLEFILKNDNVTIKGHLRFDPKDGERDFDTADLDHTSPHLVIEDIKYKDKSGRLHHFEFNDATRDPSGSAYRSRHFYYLDNEKAGGFPQAFRRLERAQKPKALTKFNSRTRRAEASITRNFRDIKNLLCHDRCEAEALFKFMETLVASFRNEIFKSFNMFGSPKESSDEIFDAVITKQVLAPSLDTLYAENPPTMSYKQAETAAAARESLANALFPELTKESLQKPQHVIV